ncbi:YfcL family protein [Enterobacteriaceae bacterium LUAb1]
MIADVEARILALIDTMVEHASDDELFASGYLRGHLTLSVAALEQINECAPEALQVKVLNSLAAAIQAGELSPRDQRLVTDMWDKLWQQVQNVS